MIRFCTKCGKQIDPDRVSRSRSPYCSPECKKEANREKRNEMASKYCRLCKRPARQPRVSKSKLEAVRPSHNDVQEVNEPVTKGE